MLLLINCPLHASYFYLGNQPTQIEALRIGKENRLAASLCQALIRKEGLGLSLQGPSPSSPGSLEGLPLAQNRGCEPGVGRTLSVTALQEASGKLGSRAREARWRHWLLGCGILHWEAWRNCPQLPAFGIPPRSQAACLHEALYFPHTHVLSGQPRGCSTGRDRERVNGLPWDHWGGSWGERRLDPRAPVEEKVSGHVRDSSGVIQLLRHGG